MIQIRTEKLFNTCHSTRHQVRVRTRATEAAKHVKRAKRAHKRRSVDAIPTMDERGNAVQKLAAQAAALRIKERPAHTQPTSCPLPSTTASSSSIAVPTSEKTNRRPRMRNGLKLPSPEAHLSPADTTTPPRRQAPAPHNDAAQQLYAEVVRVCNGNPVYKTPALGRAGWDDVPAKITGMLLAIPSILPRLLGDAAYLEKQILACVGALQGNVKGTNPNADRTKATTSSSDTSSVTSNPSLGTAPALPTQEQLSASSPELWRRLVGPHLHARVQRLVASVRDVEGLLSSKPLADKITGMLLDCTDRKRVEASLRDNQLLRHDFDSALKVLRRARDSTVEPPTSGKKIDGPIETRPSESQSIRSDSDSPQPEERTVGSLTFTVVPPRKRKNPPRVSSNNTRDEALGVTPRVKAPLTMTPTSMLTAAPTQALTAPPLREKDDECQTLEDENDGGSVKFSARTIGEDAMLTAAGEVEAELNWLQVCDVRLENFCFDCQIINRTCLSCFSEEIMPVG